MESLIGNKKEILKNLCNLLEYKDKQYGSAYKTENNVFGKGVSAEVHLCTRINEKLNRIKNSKELMKNDVTDFYCYIILLCKIKGWDNFDEQKD